MDDEKIKGDDYYTQVMDLANPMERLVAYFLDSIFIAIPVWIMFFIFFMPLILATGFSEEMDPVLLLPAMSGIVMFGLSIIVLTAMYYCYFESSAKQATWGKQIMGIYVTDMEGERISFLNALGRYLAKILSGMILWIGYIMILFTEKRQGLHDILANTLVLKGKK